MKIAFDAQLIFEKQKTGIGWTSEYILKNIIKEFDNEYYLNYFSIHKNQEKEHCIKEYKDLGYKVNKCQWFYNSLYRRMWNLIPLPYSAFFNQESQITQFFNYEVPPGAKGKAVTFIYDMVYKAFPDTVSLKTMKTLDYNLNISCKRADHIITISEFSKNEIVKYMNIEPAKISVMPCGVDSSIYHNKFNKMEILDTMIKYGISGNYILYLGTLEPRKNLERLIEAYALLNSQVDDIPQLVLAGKKGWMYDTIFNLVEQYQLKGKVVFTGYIESVDAPILISGALFFVFPSIYEGFGIPPLEAMSCGTPVMVSNQASIPEVVGEAGYYIDPYNVADMCNGMKGLMQNKELRMQLREKGLLRAKDFTWKSSVIKLMDIYNKIL